MMEALDQAWQQLHTFSGWEALATLLGLAYIVFAIRESLWAWPCAFFSTLIYTWLFWDGQLPMQALLNAYYLIMAIYGFWLWSTHPPSPTPARHATPLKVHRLKTWQHGVFLTLGSLLTIVVVQAMQSFELSRAPWLDAGVTVFSMLNTYLMARKVLENWLYWLVINSAAMWLYWDNGFYFTVLMFAVYFVMAVIGFFQWRQSARDAAAKHSGNLHPAHSG
ncbi:nicotinamide riboside transporter PnuC [Thiomicrospira sp. WB1]|uniref:nicotinamide riboside transporter PnuC n=1 Tax=Thiomicrospira sp. WB1 TaxID=1685380 RepID=UPI0007486EE0|nr:nicotinamide riboside transporter PnuC [Thiomicrospira sp. WB1]KUJ72529.1 nicotinamide mononucleotide transporter [Thiomicrospira sp. WB1]